MNDLRKTTAIWLVVSLFYLSSLQATAPAGPALMKRKVDLFGVGASVKLKLADGEKLRGSIEAIKDENFVLDQGQGASERLIAYDQVADLDLTKHRYRARGQTDLLEAKRVVAALGVGKHVVVNTTGGRELHGYIQAIEPDHFTVLPDREAAPVQILYSEVRHVEKNLSAGATLVLVILIVAAVAVVSTVIAKK